MRVVARFIVDAFNVVLYIFSWKCDFYIKNKEKKKERKERKDKIKEKKKREKNEGKKKKKKILVRIYFSPDE